MLLALVKSGSQIHSGRLSGCVKYASWHYGELHYAPTATQKIEKENTDNFLKIYKGERGNSDS